VRETGSARAYPERVLDDFGADLLKASALHARFYAPGFTRRMIDVGGRLFRRVPLPWPFHRIRGVMATFDAGYRASSASRLGVAVRFIGERDDRDFDNQERVTLGSYTLLDLSGEFALGDLSGRLGPLTLTARMENALDREYSPAFGFLAPGRTVLLGLRARFGG